MAFWQFFGTKNIITVTTDAPHYYSGQPVTGAINLSVVQPIALNHIYLKLKGFEKLRFIKSVSESVTETDANGNQITRTVFVDKEFHKDRSFFKRKYLVYQFPSAILPGNYRFPFTIPLDAGLPGCFDLKDSYQGKPYSAQIKYKLKAVVDVVGRDLKNTIPLIVHEPLFQPMSEVERTKTINVMLLCCIPKGRVTLKGSLEKNSYYPGDVVNVILDCDASASGVDMKSLSVKMMRRLTLSDGKEMIVDTDVVARAKAEGVPKGTSGQRIISLPLPMLQPGTQSPHIKAEYWVDLEANIPWAPDCEIHQKVQIYAPAPNFSIYAPPPSFQPQVMPMFQGTQFTVY